MLDDLSTPTQVANVPAESDPYYPETVAASTLRSLMHDRSAGYARVPMRKLVTNPTPVKPSTCRSTSGSSLASSSPPCQPIETSR